MNLDRELMNAEAHNDGWHEGDACDCVADLIAVVKEHLRAEEKRRNIYRQAFGFEPIRRY